MKNVFLYNNASIFDFLNGDIKFDKECKDFNIHYMDRITETNKNKYTVVLFHKLNYDIYYQIVSPDKINDFYRNMRKDGIVINEVGFFEQKYCFRNLRYFLNNQKNVNKITNFFLYLNNIKKDPEHMDRIIKNENLTVKQIYDFFESTEMYLFLKHLNPILNSTEREPHPLVFNFNVFFYTLTNSDKILSKDYIKNDKMHFIFNSKEKALYFANFFRNFSKFFHVTNIIFPLTDYLDNNVLEKIKNKKFSIKITDRHRCDYKISIDIIRAKSNNIDVKTILTQLCKNNDVGTKYYRTYSGINYKSYNSVSVFFNDTNILTYMIMVFNNYIKDITIYVPKNNIIKQQELDLKQKDQSI